MGSVARNVVGMVYSLLLRNKLLQIARETRLLTNDRAVQCRNTLCLNLRSGKFPADSMLQKKVAMNTTQKSHSIILLKIVWPAATKPFVKGALPGTNVDMPLWGYCFHP